MVFLIKEGTLKLFGGEVIGFVMNSNLCAIALIKRLTKSDFLDVKDLNETLVFIYTTKWL